MNDLRTYGLKGMRIQQRIFLFIPKNLAPAQYHDLRLQKKKTLNRDGSGNKRKRE